MKLITLTATLAAIALTTSPALFAEGYKPPVHSDPKPAPPYAYPEESSGGGADMLPILLGVILLGVIASQNQAADLSEPRPMVRPEGCFNKYGQHTFSCGGM